MLFGHKDIVSHLDISHDGKYILTIDGTKVKITHFPQVVCIHSVSFHHAEIINDAKFLTDNRFLIISDSKDLKVWEIDEDGAKVVSSKTIEDVDSEVEQVFENVINSDY